MLVVMVKQGVNDDEIPAIIDHALRWRCVRGVVLQPIQDAGHNDGFDASRDRFPLSAIRRRIIDSGGPFGEGDIIQLPCNPGKHRHRLRLTEGLGDRTGHLVLPARPARRRPVQRDPIREVPETSPSGARPAESRSPDLPRPDRLPAGKDEPLPSNSTRGCPCPVSRRMPPNVARMAECRRHPSERRAGCRSETCDDRARAAPSLRAAFGWHVNQI